VVPYPFGFHRAVRAAGGSFRDRLSKGGHTGRSDPFAAEPDAPSAVNEILSVLSFLRRSIFDLYQFNCCAKATPAKKFVG
jgi:hypothetical protein